MDSPKEILRALKTAKRILVPLHIRPDGDSIGSALGCYHFLKDLGKTVTVVSADPIPENFLFLSGAKRIRIGEPAELDLSRFDLIVLLDNAEEGRFSYQKNLPLPPQTVVVNIDHHITNAGFGDLNYVDPGAAATAELLFNLLRRWKSRITPVIADCLLTGIYTDTGGFIYSSTTTASFAKAYQLLRLGANREKIVENFFRSWPPRTLPTWAAILTNSRRQGKLIYSQLSLRDIRRLKIGVEELAPARSFATNNLLLAMGGIKVAVMFTEEKPRLTRVSLRSKAGPDVSRIAKKFGGGGHKNAAAFDYPGPLKEAAGKTVRLIKDALN